MKKKLIASAAALTIAMSCAPMFSGTSASAAVPPEYETLAFPTAEGGGMYTSGARGAENMEVYHVTSLSDSGEGSFRDAVSKGNRIVVFDVSGMIDLESRVSIAHNNITILGQTAPGDGICFRGNSVKINGKNIILRYLRFRVGSKLADGSDTATQDGFSIPIGAENVIMDHCSVSWGTDENLSVIGGKNITVQRCIISEALNSSIHEKGEHSYAGIWGGVNVSFHHNIIASHKSRNPKIGTSETVSMTPGYTDKDTVVDMWNNVIYNWGDKAGYGAENCANVNIVNNYYKPGPATPENKRARIFELSPGNKYQPNWSGDIYASGNYIDDDGADAAAVNAENWQIEKGTGVYLGTDGITYTKLDAPSTSSYLDAQHQELMNYLYNTEIQTAQDAYEDVIADAGARLPKQDLVDARIIENVTNRTAPEQGSNGSSYLLDDPVDGIPEGQEDLYDDRGYPIWISETRASDYDADGDGIADAWEDKMGLDKTNPNDSLNLGAGGYTWLEIYGENLISDNIADETVNISNTEGGKYTISLSDASAETVEFYIDGMLIDKADNGQLTGVKDGDTVIAAAYENNGVLKEAKAAVYGDDFVMPSVSGDKTRVFVWNSLNGMKPVEGAGFAFSISDALSSGMHQISAKLICADGTYKITPTSLISVKGEKAEPTSVSGNFEIIANISDVPNFVKNVYSGIYADDFVIAAGYNENFEPVIKYGKKSNDTLSEKDKKNYKYVKISVVDGHADLYAASTIGLWDKLSDNGYDYKGTDPTAGKYLYNPEDKEYEPNSIWYRVVTDFTKPEFTVDNIADNSVIGFNDSVEVSESVSGDILYAAVLFNDEIIATSNDATKIVYDDDLKRTFHIPVSFDAAQEGTLTVLCYNDNYQTTVQSFRVYVSADASPWEITDVSADGTNETYMYATNDYTFKIGGTDGNIGGTSDDCGYVYQKFTNNNRIYYRSRMQSGRQFGIMLRKSLDPESEAYFFGGEASGSDIMYVMKSRNSAGGEMTSEIIDGLSGATLYLIAEKDGDTLNIYQTENTSMLYKTKTLITSVDVSALGDEYYMGFASVCDGGGNPPDAGWIGIESFDSSQDSHIWSFNYGLDWLWQSQEKNVLSPEWEDGQMLLAPDDDYSGERYVFREYTMDSEFSPQMGTRIMLTGESPAMNIYLQTGDASTAYKVTFDSDGFIKDSEGTALGQWEPNKVYNVGLFTDIDADTMDTVCSLLVTDDSDGGAPSIVDGARLSAAANFRTQNNIEKKTPVTKAVYFEPIAGADGKYYIDNVSVWGTQGEYKIVTTENLYTFDSEDSYSGVTLGGAEPNTSKTKTISGISFTGAVRLGSAATTMTIPVTGECDITIYAASASSSESRTIVVDGTDMTFASGAEQTYHYSGEEGNIAIYGKANVDVYGVKVLSKELVKNE